MPQKGDRRKKDESEVWHHELGWISSDLSGWGADRKPEEPSLATLADDKTMSVEGDASPLKALNDLSGGS